jgi:hypothetical protein
VTTDRPDTDEHEESRAGTYTQVLVLHALVVFALWALGRYFTTP